MSQKEQSFLTRSLWQLKEKQQSSPPAITVFHRTILTIYDYQEQMPILKLFAAELNWLTIQNGLTAVSTITTDPHFVWYQIGLMPEKRKTKSQLRKMFSKLENQLAYHDEILTQMWTHVHKANPQITSNLFKNFVHEIRQGLSAQVRYL